MSSGSGLCKVDNGRYSYSIGSSGGLNAGAIVAIVVCCAVIALIVGSILCWAFVFGGANKENESKTQNNIAQDSRRALSASSLTQTSSNRV